MTQPNPKLLSLLDKIQNPIEKLQVDLEVLGLYAFPEEWKGTDEANPGIFQYNTKIFGVEVLDGKIKAREMTEKEIQAAEEEKNKKGKAPPKKGEKEVVLSPEEEEAIRLKKEAEEEEERKKQAEFDALDTETQFFVTQEDKYKNASIKFDKNISSCEKESSDLIAFEERVYDDKGDWIYLIKAPNQTEEELAKLKKAKPKNLDLKDLNPVVARGWFSFDQLTEPGVTSIEKRVYLEQWIDPELPDQEQIPRPKFDELKSYLHVKINLSPAITPLITEVQPKVEDIITKPLPIPKLPASKLCIQEFKEDLILAMESLAIEYAQLNGKDMNNQDAQKQKHINLTVQKKEALQQRKEKFLFDFNVSGKYKVLKERLKKSIVKICRDKFQKHGSITGITTDQKDQFYSDLYVFLMEKTRETLLELITQKKDDLHEDIITSYEQTQKERDNVLKNITSETEQKKLVRLADEYEILNQLDLAEKNYRNLIALTKTDSNNYFIYCQFLLRHKNFSKAEELLEKALGYDIDKKEYKQLMAAIFIRRQRYKEACVLLRSLIESDPSNTLYNLMLSFLYGKFMNEPKLAEKYKKIAEKITLRNQGLINPKSFHKTTPNPFELPSFKPLSHTEVEMNKGPQLSNEQWDDLYTQMIKYFAEYNLYDLVDKAIENVYDSTTPEMQVIQCKIELYKGKFTEALEIINKKIETDPKNFEVVMMKANICFLSEKLYESEDTFLKALKLKNQKTTQQTTLAIYLRLGYIYLKRKSWGDAKAIFAKSCEIKQNSSLSWLGLGISCLRIGEKKESEEALTQANIYDPFNGETWGYLALLCLLDQNRFTQANQALRELFKTDIAESNLNLLEELADELTNNKYYETAEKLYLKIFEISGSKKTSLANYGELNKKLGNVYTCLNKHSEAQMYYEEALNNLEGEIDKMNVKALVEQAKKDTSNPDFCE